MWLKTEEGRRIATLNLTPGIRVYGERLIRIRDLEYRLWDPFRSKLAAAIIKGLKELPIREGEGVLYLGASTGTTASHISDILGEEGVLFAVEVAPRVAREFIDRVASKRVNVVPIVEDARRPERYTSVYRKVETVYCDLAQPDQTDIAILNCKRYLCKNGSLLLAVKARSIDVLKEPDEVFEEERVKLEGEGFRTLQMIRLDPFDKYHAMIHSVWIS